jgi:Arc/MetJ-type ribon-helix-helix transcriptional regulator
VEAQTVQEGYASASKYVRALIREAQKPGAKQALEAKLLEWFQDLASEMTDADWGTLHRWISGRRPLTRRSRMKKRRVAMHGHALLTSPARSPRPLIWSQARAKPAG